MTDHSDRALLLGDDYGYPLAYYGSVEERSVAVGR